MQATMKSTPQSLAAALKVLGGKRTTTIGRNTMLELADDGTVYATYYGNKIVHYTTDGLLVSWAGYATGATRDRLNALTIGRFNLKDHEPCINGVKLDSWSAWYPVDYAG